MDKSHFGTVILNDKGYASFIANRGYRYSVKVKGKAADCFKDVPKLQRCKGITKKGTRCKKLTDNKSGYCTEHLYQKDIK